MEPLYPVSSGTYSIRPITIILNFLKLAEKYQIYKRLTVKIIVKLPILLKP